MSDSAMNTLGGPWRKRYKPEEIIAKLNDDMARAEIKLATGSLAKAEVATYMEVEFPGVTSVRLYRRAEALSGPQP